MIDRIRMNKVIDIPSEKFNSTWKEFKNRSDGYGFSYEFDNLLFQYSVTSKRLTIIGRLINASIIPNRVDNYDVILVGAAGTNLKQEHSIDEAGERKIRYYYESYFQDFPALIASLNNKLKELLDIDVDVSTFKVTHIEICYNVPTEYVNQYIELFNLIFDKRSFPRHKDFTIEKKKQYYTSCYIKTKSTYEKNDKSPNSYVVNFYNKYDQLNSLIGRARRAMNRRNSAEMRERSSAAFSTLAEIIDEISNNSDYNPFNVSATNSVNEPATIINHTTNDEKIKSQKVNIQLDILPFRHIDLQKAKNVLRLEVQCYYNLLKKICSDYNIDNKTRPFAEFLNPNMCRNVIVKKYEFFIGSGACDFYSYKEAQKKVQQSTNFSVIKKKNLLEYIKGLSQNSPKISENYEKMLKELGIHWFFIPKQWNIDYLESPIKLLDKHLSDLDNRRNVAPIRALSAELVASLYDSIEEKDDVTEKCYYDNNGDAPLQ